MLILFMVRDVFFLIGIDLVSELILVILCCFDFYVFGKNKEIIN